MELHIFNPETDYALAANSISYTPPMAVSALKMGLALLPAIYAEPKDAILLPENYESFLNNNNILSKLVSEKNIQLVPQNLIRNFLQEYPRCVIRPWGWNRALVHWLGLVGIPQSVPTPKGPNAFYPNPEQLETLRQLSHRRTSIQFMRNFKDLCHPHIEIPREEFSTNEVMQLSNAQSPLFIKAPWSSSGRGLLFTQDLLPRHIEPWVRGTIKHQGSVTIEKAYKKQIDFATEWECKHGEVQYLGLSPFTTSNRGKYKSNEVGSQEELTARVLACTDIRPDINNLSDIIKRQKLLMETHIAPFYDGPAGIDMLVTDEGIINPCIEINLRMTMGRVAIEIDRRLNSSTTSDFEKVALRMLSVDGLFSPFKILEDTNGNQKN